MSTRDTPGLPFEQAMERLTKYMTMCREILSRQGVLTADEVAGVESTGRLVQFGRNQEDVLAAGGRSHRLQGEGVSWGHQLDTIDAHGFSCGGVEHRGCQRGGQGRSSQK